MIPQYENFASAYQAGLEAVLASDWVDPVFDDSSIGSRFGNEFRRTRELRPFVFQVADPSTCLIESPVRQPNLGYSIGQWIWVMTGSDELEQITYYNPRGQVLSEDGIRLPGAFGARIRRSAGDQLERALRLLRRDPGSRRAAILIAEASDSRSTIRDYPCAIGVQLMLRNGKLEVITNMRSQSALMVLPYDAALFMMLHVWAAAVLGVDCGPHTWIANSFHLYEDEVAHAREVLAAGLQPASVPTKVERPISRFKWLSELERRLRISPESVLTDPPEIGHVDEFHSALASVLVAVAGARCSDGGHSAQVLPSDWRRLWLQRVQAS